MNLSYRARQRLRRFFTGLLILGIVAVLVWLCWVIWLGRFVVYTPDGAKLDFQVSVGFPEGSEAAAPDIGQTVPIFYDDPQADPEGSAPEQTGIRGYYIEFDALKADIAAVQKQLEALPAGTAVLLDLKDTKGLFHYATSVGSTRSDAVDAEAMDAFLNFLSNSKLYTIARIPAFRDWEYGLNNVPCGLPKADGNGSLWMDDTNCYWLDPANEQVQSYLVRIAMELRNLGFNEVVFSDFRFPDMSAIRYEGDQSKALADAAKVLADACATNMFCVSFLSSDPAFPLPEGNCRLYLSGIAAADLPRIVPQVQTDDPAAHLLFLTELTDTRYDAYSVLRPLSLLQ